MKEYNAELAALLVEFPIFKNFTYETFYLLLSFNLSIDFVPFP